MGKEAYLLRGWGEETKLSQGKMMLRFGMGKGSLGRERGEEERKNPVELDEVGIRRSRWRDPVAMVLPGIGSQLPSSMLLRMLCSIEPSPARLQFTGGKVDVWIMYFVQLGCSSVDVWVAPLTI